MLAARTDTGWQHLRQGRWAAARECFAGSDSAEAQEGLSWAAWWLDDADTVFAAREGAYRRYRERGDAAAAARMAIWIGVDQRDFNGAVAVANGWLERARRLLEPLDACPEHGWLAFHEGYLLNAAGEGERARRLAVEAADLGRRFEVADLELLGLALEGSSLVASGDVEEGMRRLDEATVIALEAQALEIPISSAWACCFLVSSCLAVYDFERAFAWSDRIAEFAARYGSRWMLAFCRAEYGAVYRWRGQWDRAETMLEAAIEDFTSSRPAWAPGPLAGLAELRRRQGRTAEALQLLERAGATSAAQLTHARMILDRGDPQAAAELAERLLRRTPPQRRLDRVPVLDLLIRAATLDHPQGGLTPSSVHPQGGQTPSRVVEGWVAELRELAVLAGTPALRAVADRAEGLAVGGERGRVLLEDAVDAFAAAGAPYEAAEARLELAAVLERLGRDGARERTLAAEVLRGLGARDAPPPLPELTAREREVLALVAEGLTNRQLAERLVVSEHTVHRHVTNILRKLDLPSRAAAAALGVRSGLK